MYNRLVKNKPLILSIPLLLASLFVGSHVLPSAHAQLTGLVCITASTTATSCPASPPSIPVSIGQTFTVGVFVQGSDAMGGWDIYVMSDPAFLNPTGAALGTLVANPSLTSICINGAATTGSCTVNTANGLGVVEATTIESSGGNECGGISPCSGMALTITYHVVAATPSTTLSYPTAAGCSNSSVSSPPNVCVLIADAFGTPLSENIQGATVTQTVVTDPTTTTVSCSSPVPVGASTSCAATVTDTAATGATNPTGQVTWTTDGFGSFSLGNSCDLSSLGVNQSTCSVFFTPTAIGSGTDNIGATYLGDSTHAGSTAPSFALSVTKSTPSLTTVLISASIPPLPLGFPVSDLAILSGGFPSTGVTGTVTYTLIPNGLCTAGTGTVVSTYTVGPADDVPPSASVMPAAGSYSFNAVYSGDASNNAVTSACEPFTVVPAPSFTAGKLHWTHHLSLSKNSNTQSWTAIVTNPLSATAEMVVRIVGTSTTNPSLSFDVTCGVTCVNTAGGVNFTPGLTPVSVAAGASSFSFNFNQPISSTFANEKFTFTATLYWTTGTLYNPSNSKSGAFAVVP
jgi:hypothetical protein